MKGFMYEAYMLLESETAKQTFEAKHSNDLSNIPVSSLHTGSIVYMYDDEDCYLAEVSDLIPMDEGETSCLRINLKVIKPYCDHIQIGDEKTYDYNPKEEITEFTGDITTVYTPSKSDFDKKLNVIKIIVDKENPKPSEMLKARKVFNALSSSEKLEVKQLYPNIEKILFEN